MFFEESAMNNLGRKIAVIIASLLYGSLLSAPVLAADTEIYLGANQGVARSQPNVLFIVDTSGSMRTLVTTRDDYDPAGDYSAGGCTEFTSDKVFTSNDTDCDNDRYFDASALKCDKAVQALASTGLYVDTLAMWRWSGKNKWARLRWSSISTDSGDRAKPVECSADSGVHGVDAGSADVYATDSSGPYTSIEANEVDWGDAGNSVTLYSAHYLNYLKTTTTTSKKRIDIVKDVVTNVVNSVSNINIGLMRFDRGANWYTSAEGGMVVTEMGPIGTDTHKTAFLAALAAMQEDGSTPLSETLIEAGLYFRGDDVHYGLDSHIKDYVSLPSIGASRVTDDSVTPAVVTDTYKSPIELQCQKNFVVFLTDGEPTSDSPNSTRLTSVGVSSCSGNCLDEVAGALASNDQSDSLAEVQRVSTYTIGFATDQTLLSATAAASKNGSGAGKYYTADDTEELTNAFTNILTDILGVSSTFSSPAVSVNAFNRTSHRSDLYFTLFKPSTGPRWDGNFKRYKLTFESDGSPVVKDAEDKLAVSDTTGYFRDDAVSYWTQSADAPDGAAAEVGGMASRLANPRTVYTYTGADAPDETALSAYMLHEDNTTITTAMLGVESEAEPAVYRTKLLKWARGLDVDDNDGDGDETDARRVMGDPLHGQPALVQYGGSDTDPDLTAFVVTNDGYLHAVNTQLASGTEIFSFVPKELLDRLAVFYEDDNNVTKAYGIDGSVVPWVVDVNENGVIETGGVVEAGDKVVIFFGMRRGGNNYYAMDVTNRAAPVLKWVIKGGAGGTTGFTELAQSWSKPTLRKIRLAGVDKHVLIFGGGYDTAQDGVSVKTADVTGRAIYIVEADTGTLLWSASKATLTDMDYSIPSDIAAVDTKGDGYVNMLYVGDMGGQIWRFDIPRSETAGQTLADVITGGRIANFSTNASAADARRFFYPPDLALLKNNSGASYLALIAVSGNRSNPLNLVVQNRMYMIRPGLSIPGTYTTLSETDLYDTTLNTIGNFNSTAEAVTTATTALAGKSGWLIKLEATGEKGLSKPLIFAGNAFVTTYIPTVDDADPNTTTCMPTEGWGRLYIISMADGTPVFNFDTTTVDSDEEFSKADRIRTLNKAGIPADPIMIRTNDANQKNIANCIGTECFEVDNTNQRTSLYWYEK